MCPNINNEQIINEFNEIVTSLGGNPLTIEEFRDKELRLQRTGIDAAAMDAAYDIWDQNQGNPIDRAPNGAESVLFKSLVDYYGDRQKAIKAKANTYSETFKNWFGNWTDLDATDVSKVVDENGEPLMVYHHTDDENLNEFSTEFDNYFAKTGGTKKAIFFDENATGTLNRKYDLPVFLNIRELTTYVGTKEDLHKQGTDYREVVNISAKNNDVTGGLHMSKFDDNRMEDQSIWIIHHSNQVKSIDNRGTFSTTDYNIYKQNKEETTTNQSVSIATIFGVNVGAFTSNEVLDRIEQYLPNKKQLIDLFRQFNIQIEIVESLPDNDYAYYHKREDKIYISQSVWDEQSIGYNANSVLHELVHAFTELALYAAETGRANKEEMKVYNTVKSLLEYYRKIYPPYKNSKGELIYEKYGLTNEWEFVAEFLTNDSFVTDALLVSQQNNSENKFLNLLKEVWDSIVQYLTGKRNRNLSQDEIALLTKQLYDIMQNDIQFRLTDEERFRLQTRESHKLLKQQREHFEAYNFGTKEELDKQLKKLRSDLVTNLESQLKSVDIKDPVKANELREQIKYQIKNLSSEIITDIDAIVAYTADLKLDLSPIVKQVIDAYNGRIDPLTDEQLVSFNKNYFGFYCKYAEDAVGALNNLREYREIIGPQLYDKLTTDLSICKQLLDNCAAHLKRMQVRRAQQIMKEVGLSVNSPTILAYIEENSDNTNYDISSITRAFLSGDKIADEAIKVMFHMMQQTENKINDVTFEVANRLLSLAKKAGNRQKVLFEVDDDGKPTGYIIRERNYGKFYNAYKKEMEKIRLELGLSPKELTLPENREVRIQYQKRRNEWLSKHCERRYTQQYYEYLYDLSDETSKARELIQSKIRDLCDKYRDIDGIVQFEKFTDEEYKRLESLYLEKKQLASIYDIYGNEKPQGSVERQIAEELTALNEKLAKGLKMKANREKFEAVRAQKEATLSKTDYKKWYARNTRTVYSQEWYDMLAKIDRVEYGEAYALLNNQKREILRQFRDDKTGEINTDLMPNSTKNLINRLDARMRVLRKKKKRNKDQKGVAFEDIAKIVPTDKFKRDYAKAQEAEQENPGTLHEFEMAHMVMAADGTMYPKSYYTKIVPKDSKYIETEPSTNFSELSEESPFFNKNYDPNIGEYYQPKKELYDNSAKFAEMKKDADLYALYNELVSVMDESNQKLDNTMGLNKYKLPQISGSFYRYLVAYRFNPFKAFKNWIVDKFSIRNDDVGYGESVATAPDGTELHLIPKFFIKDLDDPTTISMDIVGSVIQYFRMAENFKQKSLIKGKMENIKAFIAQRSYTPIKDSRKWYGKKDSPKIGTATNIYKFAEKFINMNLYGIQTNNLTINIKGRDINFAKLMKTITGYGTVRNLALNLYCAATGFFTALHTHLVKAAVGRYYDFHDAAAAFKDIVWDLLKYGINAGCKTYKSQQMAAMDYFGVGSTMDSMWKDSNRPRIIRVLTEHWGFGTYSLSDYIMKGQVLNSVMYNYKNVNGEFLNKEEYFNKYGNSEETRTKWRTYKSFKGSIQFINGKLVAKDKKDQEAVDKIKHTIGDTARSLAAAADGQLTPLQKAQFTTNVFGAACMMHRNYIAVTLSNTFMMKRQWDYNSKREVEATLLSVLKLIQKLWHDKNIGDTINTVILNKGIEDNIIRTNVKQFKIEMLLILALYPYLATLASEWADKDRRNKLKNFLAYVLARTSFETKALYDWTDIYNTIKTPTPLYGLFDTVFNITAYPFDLIYRIFFDEDNPKNDRKISRGAYKGWTPVQRDIMKATPFKNVYELNDIPSKRRYYETQIMN